MAEDAKARLDPDEVAHHRFPSVRRGFDPAEVHRYLATVATEMRVLHASIVDLEARLGDAELRVSETDSADAGRVASLVGAETTRILDAAREAAVQITERAEAVGADIRREADEVLEQRRAEAEREVAAVVARAEEALAAADDESALVVDQAKEEGRRLVREAQAVRERILKDLARRRRLGRTQIEQLRVGRERLLAAYDVVRTTLDEATGELAHSVSEARAAAAAVAPDIDGGEAEADELASLEAALEAAHAVQHPVVVDAAVEDIESAGAAAAPPDRTESGSGYAPASPADEALRDDIEVDEAEVVPPSDEPTVVPIPPVTDRRGGVGRVFRRGDSRYPEAREYEALEREVSFEGVRVVGGLSASSGTEPETETTEDDARDADEAAVESPEVDEAVGDGVPGGSSDTAALDDDASADAGAGEDDDEPGDVALAPTAGTDDGASADPAAGDDDGASADAGAGEDDVTEAVTAARSVDPDALFAQMRAAREEAHATADDNAESTAADSEDLAAGDAVHASGDGATGALEPSGANDPAASSQVVDGDEAPEPIVAFLEARDRAVAGVERLVTRRLKRLLADEQNEALDAIRRVRGRPSLQAIYGTADQQSAVYVAGLERELADAVHAGAEAAGGSADAGLAAAAAGGIVDEVLDDLRSRLATVFDESAGDEEELSERVRAAYREWKGRRIAAVVRTGVLAAHTFGVYDASPPGAGLCWLAALDGSGCPDADDNALAGVVDRGDPFPTRHRHPPAHPDCHCALIPASVVGVDEPAVAAT